MTRLPLDVALNLLWAGIALSLLGVLLWQEWHASFTGGSTVRLRRLCAVLLAGICLFPAVSYSDDLFFFALLDSRIHTRGGVGSEPPGETKDRDSIKLCRLLQGLEDCRTEAALRLFVAPGGVAMVFVPRLSVPGIDTLRRSGRAPPVL